MRNRLQHNHLLYAASVILLGIIVGTPLALVALMTPGNQAWLMLPNVLIGLVGGIMWFRWVHRV